MDITRFNNLIRDNDIYPGIDKLVDVLFTSEINNLIDTKCETDSDKRVFLMFLIMYFYTYLNIPNVVKTSDIDIKQNLKIFLTDLIKNPDKRLKCIELYKSFEDSIKYLS